MGGTATAPEGSGKALPEPKNPRNEKKEKYQDIHASRRANQPKLLVAGAVSGVASRSVISPLYRSVFPALSPLCLIFLTVFSLFRMRKE
jgi:hypothetical protein